MQIKIGADPELFVRKAGASHSAWALVPGDKDNPHPVPHGTVQVDGMALEIGIDPVTSKEEFKHHINSVLATLRDMVPQEFEFDISASTEFSIGHVASLPKKALEVGCDPDLDAYSLEENPSPDAASRVRAAGGHVHIGWTQDAQVDDPLHRMAGAQLVKALDWWLGMPSALIDPDKVRKSMYGCAGAFRPKPYGAEYRVLSNFWLRDDRLMDFVYDQTMKACEDAMSGRFGQTTATNGSLDKATAIINGLEDGAVAEDFVANTEVITGAQLQELKEAANG